MWKKKNKSGGVVVYVFALGHNFSCRMETDPGEGNAIVVFLKNYHQIWQCLDFLRLSHSFKQTMSSLKWEFLANL